jgi:hypothetical protein
MSYQLSPISPGCTPQTTGLKDFATLADSTPAEIVAFFQAHPDSADQVLGQSYDKRYSPSTFVEEANGAFRVGWCDGARKHMRRFPTLAEAAADYLLFSFGRGRLEVT